MMTNNNSQIELEMKAQLVADIFCNTILSRFGGEKIVDDNINSNECYFQVYYVQNNNIYNPTFYKFTKYINFEYKKFKKLLKGNSVRKQITQKTLSNNIREITYMFIVDRFRFYLICNSSSTGDRNSLILENFTLRILHTYNAT